MLRISLVLTLFVIFNFISGCQNDFQKATGILHENRKELDDLLHANLHKIDHFRFHHNNELNVASADSIRLSEKERDCLVRILVSLTRRKQFSEITYYKNKYLLCHMHAPSRAILFLYGSEDEELDLDNYSGTLKELLKRSANKTTPYAQKLDQHWYFVHLSHLL